VSVRSADSPLLGSEKSVQSGNYGSKPEANNNAFECPLTRFAAVKLPFRIVDPGDIPFDFRHKRSIGIGTE